VYAGADWLGYRPTGGFYTSGLQREAQRPKTDRHTQLGPQNLNTEDGPVRPCVYVEK